MSYSANATTSSDSIHARTGEGGGGGARSGNGSVAKDQNYSRHLSQSYQSLGHDVSAALLNSSASSSSLVEDDDKNSNNSSGSVAKNVFAQREAPAPPPPSPVDFGLKWTSSSSSLDDVPERKLE